MQSSALRRSLVCGTFLATVIAVCAGGLVSVRADSQAVQAVPLSAPTTSPAPAPAALAVTEPVDATTLEAALAGAGVDLPEGSSVYAVRLEADGTAAAAYEAGEGAEYDGFWPASSVKLLAAVGALEYLADLGFTGEARITMDGETFTVADLYREAVADSSNEAYDQLVRIAGVDWLNEEFLTAGNGFADTVIQRSYTGWGVDVSPAMTVVEDGRRLTVPAREATGAYGCEDGNCSTLLELTESVRRVTLDAELAEDERFDIAAADAAGLTDALLAAEGFVEPAVAEVLGEDALVYNKPGYVPGGECVDVALLSDEAAGERYLLAIETPEDGWLCPGLVEVAAATLQFLEEETEG